MMSGGCHSVRMTSSTSGILTSASGGKKDIDWVFKYLTHTVLVKRNDGVSEDLGSTLLMTNMIGDKKGQGMVMPGHKKHHYVGEPQLTLL